MLRWLSFSIEHTMDVVHETYLDEKNVFENLKAAKTLGWNVWACDDIVIVGPPPPVLSARSTFTWKPYIWVYMKERQDVV